MPRTSVPSERVFSTSGLVVNDLRSRLSAAIVDALVFANRNTLALARPSAPAAPAAVEKTQEKQDVAAVEDDSDSEDEIHVLPHTDILIVGHSFHLSFTSLSLSLSLTASLSL